MQNDDSASLSERAGIESSMAREGTSSTAGGGVNTNVSETDAPPVRYQVGDIMDSELATRFKYHAPKPDQLPRYEELRQSGLALAKKIMTLTPAGREQALALTKLEEALMHANSAIARRE